jgi:hypothetical protein
MYKPRSINKMPIIYNVIKKPNWLSWKNVNIVDNSTSGQPTPIPWHS